MFIMKKTLLFLSFFISLSIFAQNDIIKIDSIVNSKIAENDPGLMVGIVKEGHVIYENYFGLSNLQHQVKISAETRSNIASTAKQFTALMILDLALNKELSLDDDIRKHLPNLYNKVEGKIKIRHLINHTSGIRDYVELMSLQNKIWWKQVGLDNDDVIKLLEKQEDLAFRPGSKYSYSNSGYIILTKIIEQVSGKKFEEYSKLLFRKLGMNETYFIEGYARIIPNRAEPYADWGDGVWLQTPTVTRTKGEGFLYTTLKDQLIYEQAIQLANKNNNILLVKSQQPIPNSEIRTYGFGLKLENRLNRNSVHHDGVTTGYNSQTIRFPNDKLTVFIMSNNGKIRSDLLADEIASILLPKIKINDRYNRRLFENIKYDEKPKILGQYRYPDGDILVRIEKEEEKVYWKEGNYYKLEMIPERENIFSFSNNPKLKVVFYENEMVEFYDSGNTMNYKRIEESPASFTDLESFVGKYFNNELNIGFEIRLTEKNELLMSLSNKKREQDIHVLNRNELLSDNFMMKSERDNFNRVKIILLTYGRAKNISFKKLTNLKFQPKIKTQNGTIQVTTISSKCNDSSNILLTKNDAAGNEIWFKQYGGKSFDKASSIISTEDGYLIVGSTSSYGKGNYDMFVIKTDKKGKKIWQNTYGEFGNEYGYSAKKTKDGFLIKGTKQKCTSNTDVFNRTCNTNVWFVTIDKNGKEIYSKILEEVSAGF